MRIDTHIAQIHYIARACTHTHTHTLASRRVCGKRIFCTNLFRYIIIIFITTTTNNYSCSRSCYSTYIHALLLRYRYDIIYLVVTCNMPSVLHKRARNSDTM